MKKTHKIKKNYFEVKLLKAVLYGESKIYAKSNSYDRNKNKKYVL